MGIAEEDIKVEGVALLGLYRVYLAVVVDSIEDGVLLLFERSRAEHA